MGFLVQWGVLSLRMTLAEEMRMVCDAGKTAGMQAVSSYAPSVNNRGMDEDDIVLRPVDLIAVLWTLLLLV